MKIPSNPFVVALTLAGLTACGGAESDTTEMNMPPGDPVGDAASTAGVLCAVQDSGMQRLIYDVFDFPTGESESIDESLAYEYAWSCSNAERTLVANGVPNHGVAGGVFATPVSAQTVNFTVTLAPQLTDTATTVKEPGYALNGVKFDPATAGTCPDDAADDGACDYGMGGDTWRMVATAGATSPWRFDFGVDENDAHVQPTGAYHYHGNPVNLVAQLNPDFVNRMTLVGWATDGFPIYSLRGHSDPASADSGLVEMRSSYQTVDAPAAGRPAVSDFALGHFEQDWQYVAGSGDLDECNGRFAVTPEFPQGIYHYYTTSTYPFVQRCVRGTSEGGNIGAPDMMGPPGMGPPGGMGPPPGR